MTSTRHAILSVALACISSACVLGNEPPPAPVEPAVTCAVWTMLSDDERIAVADRLVDSPELLERVRTEEGEPAGTPRELLIRDVVRNVARGCDGVAPPGPPVSEVFADRYLR